MTLDSVLTRLEIMHDEIVGLTPFKEPPRLIESDSCPLCYGISTGFEDRQNSKAVVIARVWGIDVEVLVRPFNMDTFTIETISDGISETHDWIDTIATYYTNHRMMNTEASLATLDFILSPGMVISGGDAVFPMAGPDGNDYFGTKFNLQIPLSVPVS